MNPNHRMGKQRLGLNGWGPRVLALRLKLGLKQPEMAVLLGIKTNLMSYIEHGRSALPLAARPLLEALEAKS